eukprot:CAMPEP_0197179866 /NCGR_PEP_ID=MMETSP1423-20130617/4671_1 /TAXON_ID=476441 /ORGANISM="Pseudo-nitzschia heimii, Strain UNC1101" /LENGTH=986 /DNA_ID=CAMNT_0042629847 /DNA_START=46 /DNA_END=3006 /DNA_ORIENTATION=-
MGSDYGPSSTAAVTSMASAMLFGTIIFATTALAVHSYLAGYHKKLFEAASHPKSTALDVKSLTSVYTLLFHSSIFGLILLYAYVCEHHPPYPHADKNYDADIFFFLTFLLFVVSAFTWKKHVPDHPQNTTGTVAPSNDKTEVLNRDQTEEWKGWMQFMFLLYHYYHAEDVYNSIRIMITCYVWMTGFGNFSFFYLKADYGIIRVLQMLWRLNFLVLFLCLTQGTTFILYYICLLHTYYFFMVYIVMRIGNERNYTKWWIRIKLALLGVFIYLVWDCDLGLFKAIHYPFFGETPMMGATGGAMWEWYFRSSLDHWSTYLGMIFALNFPVTSLFFRKLEAVAFPRHFLAKGLMGAAISVPLYFWVTGPFMQGKFDYNQTNAYYGIIPVTAYIYFRNVTPSLRNHSLDLLHQIGKTTLETYLMQHHIWLTSDAKSLLTLIPGWPKVNFLLVSVIYVFLSRRLYQLTLFLRGMVLPNNRDACFRNLGGMISVIVCFCCLAYFMEVLNLLTLKTVGLVSFVGGYFLYLFALTHSNHVGNTADIEQPNGNARAINYNSKMVACAVAAFAVASCGFGWNIMAATGATKIKTLPSTCDVYANEGQWLPLNGCDEGPRGEEYRKFGISTVSTCSAQNEVYVWGWNDQQSSSHCRFKQRDVKSLKKHLKGRTIYFAGDSTTRYLYHSFCRQLGEHSSGSYNANEEKHRNFSKTIGDITVNFVWASYATDVVETVANLTSNEVENKPDLVVLGGGAWDKLWRYDTDEEKQQLKSVVRGLADRIQYLKKKVPVVWVTPTTINSAALPTPEKQERLNENEMKLIRGLYQSEGILSSSSFVIDGESFTHSRVNESYDGVHYPHNVYSAGAQILCNSVDWLLPTPNVDLPAPPKRPGEMSHPKIGFFLLCFAAAGIFLFDGFLGFSYFAAIIVPMVSPKGLYYEAFSVLHQKHQLPALEIQILPASSFHSDGVVQNNDVIDGGTPKNDTGEEMSSLIGKER